MRVDLLADKYSDWITYKYVRYNPIRSVDRDVMEVDTVVPVHQRPLMYHNECKES